MPIEYVLAFDPYLDLRILVYDVIGVKLQHLVMFHGACASAHAADLGVQKQPHDGIVRLFSASLARGKKQQGERQLVSQGLDETCWADVYIKSLTNHCTPAAKWPRSP